MNDIAEDKSLEQLVGVVEHITYKNENNSFTVLNVSTGTELVCAVGILPGVAEGEEIKLLGTWDVHSTYGAQFKAKYFERELPNSAGAILKYLTSGSIKGIGPATGRRLVEAFGSETLEIIQNDPEQLAKIKGITPIKAKMIANEFKKQFGVREVMLHLSKFNITSDEALAIYRVLGANSVDTVMHNPYVLCEEGIRFKFERADEIAERLGISSESTERIWAGIKHILAHNTLNGHTCLPSERLISISSEFLQLDSSIIEQHYTEMINKKQLCNYEKDGKLFAFLNYFFQSEQNIASRIKLMRDFNYVDATSESEILKKIKAIEKSHSIAYEETQIKAINLAVNEGFLILTGGPGTGKTTTLNAIINILDQKGLAIKLVAPTGRAAKRMSELTGKDASTIHRLLEVEWATKGAPSFARNEQNPIECDVLVIDELSMVDSLLFDCLMRASRLGCRVIMVGDSDQLPSVGAGNVLADLIDSHCIPTIKLTKIFRQAMSSLIVTNAHSIVNGDMPKLDVRDSDFFMLNEPNPKTAVNTVRDLYIKRLPTAYGFNALNSIQILAPSRKRDLGTVNINNVLQQAINPESPDKGQIEQRGFILRVGDKVMHSRNNYDITWSKDNDEEGTGVFNGDIGILESINRSSGAVLVRFDDRLALYSLEDVKDLELAYAITIHKSQGSEYDCVIMPLLDMPPQLCYRNLLYTGATRAKKLLVLVGQKSVVYKMVENNKKTLRYTCLSDMIKAMCKSEDEK